MCKPQRSLQSKLPPFLDSDGFIAYSKRSVCLLKEVSVDVVSVVEDNLIEGGHLKLFKLAEGKCFNLDEIPPVSKFQDRRPLFNVCLIDRVLSKIGVRNHGKRSVKHVLIVEYPKEALEIDLERVLEEKGIVIGRSFAKLARRGRVGKFVEEKCRIACEEVAVDTEYIVFHLLIGHH
jgi:hypothetical protein